MPADIYEGAFAGCADVTKIVSAAAQVEIAANIAAVKALIPDITTPGTSPHTDFDLIHPETARKLRAELDALGTSIAAAPTE